MTRKKTEKVVSAHWLDLINRVAMAGESFSVLVESKKKATQLRWHFYDARRTLELDPERADLFKASLAVSVTFEEQEKGWLVRFEQIEGRWDSKLIEAALRGEEEGTL